MVVSQEVMKTDQKPMTREEHRRLYKITKVEGEKGDVYYLNLKHESPGKFKAFQVTGLNEGAIDSQLDKCYQDYVKEFSKSFAVSWKPGNLHRMPVTVTSEYLRETKPDYLEHHIQASHRAMARIQDEGGFPERPARQFGLDVAAALGLFPRQSFHEPEPNLEGFDPPTKEQIKAVKELGIDRVERPGIYPDFVHIQCVDVLIEREHSRLKKIVWERFRVYLEEERNR